MTSPTPGPAATENPRAGWRQEMRAFAELFAISGLAIAQPVLDVFGRAPEQFIFRGATRRDIILFGLAVVVVVPLFAYLVEVFVGLVSAAARRVVHAGMLGLLAWVLVVFIADGMVGRTAALLLAVPVAALFVFTYLRTRGAAIWLAFLSPAPVAFLVIFLVGSQVAPLMKGPAGALGVPVGKPTRTVVVLFDELPLVSLLDVDGGIDADLFPNFARLAESSNWYRQATAVSNTTYIAAPAILTARLPTDGKAPTSASFPKNLFTLVGGAMPTTSSEVMTQLCPASLCKNESVRQGGLAGLLGDARNVLGQRLSPADPEPDPMTGMVEETEPAEADGAKEEFDVSSDGGEARFNRFVDGINADKGLHYIHLLLPHSPYRLLPDGTYYPDESTQAGRLLDGWVDEPEPVALGRQRFLLQLQRVDALLGRLMDRLQERGMWNDTNLVVLSDHGNGFEPGGPFRAMTAANAKDDTAMAEIAWVPFFVKAAGQTKGVVSDDPVRNIDLVPTLADLLDVKIPWKHDGRSAYAGGSGDEQEVGVHLATVLEAKLKAGPYRSLDRERGHKLLMNRTTGAFAPAAGGVEGSQRIYRVGPNPELWGKPVPPRLKKIDVKIASWSDASDVDLSSGELPALFGAVPEHPEVGQRVAIAVNGTVWATTTVYEMTGDIWGDSGPRIDAILPVEAFVAGSNDIGVYAID